MLCVIRGQCAKLIDVGGDALDQPLTTAESDADSAEAREALTRAVSAAKLLLAHLEENYEFGFGVADYKGESCPD